MGRPILLRDTDREIVLAAPRGGAVLRAVLLSAAALGVRLLFPSAWIAPSLLGLLALWALVGALRVHRLRLDLVRRTYCYRRGWWFAPPRREGGLEDVTAVYLDRHECEAGLAASRLRSRLIRLRIPACSDGGTFVLGFPMGPRVAAEKAAEYARRLGVALVDRSRLGDSGMPLGRVRGQAENLRRRRSSSGREPGLDAAAPSGRE